MYTNFIDEEDNIKQANYPATQEAIKKNARLARRDAKKIRIKASKKARNAARKALFKIMQNEVAYGDLDSDFMSNLCLDFKKIFSIRNKKLLFLITKNYS